MDESDERRLLEGAEAHLRKYAEAQIAELVNMELDRLARERKRLPRDWEIELLLSRQSRGQTAAMTIGIVAVIVTIVGTGIALNGSMHGRMDTLNGRVNTLDERMDERLRTLEIDVAELKVEVRELRTDVTVIRELLEGNR